MTQDQVSEIMYHAQTLEQTANAWQVRSAYLLAHPDDEAIVEEGESLWMREQALKHPNPVIPQADRAA